MLLFKNIHIGRNTRIHQPGFTLIGVRIGTTNKEEMKHLMILTENTTLNKLKMKIILKSQINLVHTFSNNNKIMMICKHKKTI
jgi:hypothetical protein